VTAWASKMEQRYDTGSHWERLYWPIAAPPGVAANRFARKIVGFLTHFFGRARGNRPQTVRALLSVILDPVRV
jgi:hypothetical protein